MHRDRVSDKEKGGGRLRLFVQLAFAVLLNGYAVGFAKGRIFTGKLKGLCVPVLNCYSCPGALGACPIGSVQAMLSGVESKIPFYVLGFLMLFGALFGRLLCGFVCPFGLVQDLLHKIPGKKLKVPKKTDRLLRFVKYGVLLVFVILLPLLFRNGAGAGDPFFCKYICPAGTLEGGIPLLLTNEGLRDLAGALFGWKTAVLAAVLVGSVFIPRFFCRYLCPLGAFYALFNRFSLYRMMVDKEKCVHCGKCSERCPMALNVPENVCSGECIRCGKCKSVCPTGAVSSGFELKPEKREVPKTQNEG